MWCNAEQWSDKWVCIFLDQSLFSLIVFQILSNYHFQSSEVSAIIQQQRRLSLISIFYCFASSFLFLLKTSSEYSFVKTEQKWWCLQKCDINQVGILFRRNSPAMVHTLHSDDHSSKPSICMSDSKNPRYMYFWA